MLIRSRNEHTTSLAAFAVLDVEFQRLVTPTTIWYKLTC